MLVRLGGNAQERIMSSVMRLRPHKYVRRNFVRYVATGTLLFLFLIWSWRTGGINVMIVGGTGADGQGSIIAS